MKKVKFVDFIQDFFQIGNYVDPKRLPTVKNNLALKSNFCGALCSKVAIVFTYPYCITNPTTTESPSLFSSLESGVTCSLTTALFPFRQTISL